MSWTRMCTQQYFTCYLIINFRCYSSTGNFLIPTRIWVSNFLDYLFIIKYYLRTISARDHKVYSLQLNATKLSISISVSLQLLLIEGPDQILVDWELSKSLRILIAVLNTWAEVRQFAGNTLKSNRIYSQIWSHSKGIKSQLL